MRSDPEKRVIPSILFVIYTTHLHPELKTNFSTLEASFRAQSKGFANLPDEKARIPSQFDIEKTPSKFKTKNHTTHDISHMRCCASYTLRIKLITLQNRQISL